MGTILQYLTFLTLSSIYSPCARLNDAIKTNKVPVERQITRLSTDTSHDEHTPIKTF